MATEQEKELRFLRSYLGGPRIWDAAVLQVWVHSLIQQKLIEPVPDAKDARLHQITQLGRETLERSTLHGCI